MKKAMLFLGLLLVAGFVLAGCSSTEENTYVRTGAGPRAAHPGPAAATKAAHPGPDRPGIR